MKTNQLNENEISELYYLAIRQFNYYNRKYKRLDAQNIKSSKTVYLYERCKTFNEICNKLLCMNPNTLVNIDDI